MSADCCSDVCPVYQLAEQTGERPGCTHPSNATPDSTYRPGQHGEMHQGDIYDDTGSGARFFARASHGCDALDYIASILSQSTMFCLYLTDLDHVGTLGVQLRREGHEIIDTVVIQMSSGQVYGLLTRDMEADTIVEQVIWHGPSELLDIDAGRISTGPDGKAHAGEGKLRSHYRDSTEDQAEPEHYQDNKGRWPTNTVFVHADACRQEEAKPENSASDEDECSRSCELERLSNQQQGGVDRWNCSSICTVRTLKNQSGERPGCTHPSGAAPSSKYRPGQHGDMTQGDIYDDTGTAARFYKQANSLEDAVRYLETLGCQVDDQTSDGENRDRSSPPFYYVPKASSSEKNEGCEHLCWVRTQKADGPCWVEVDESVYRAIEAYREACDKLNQMGLDPTPTGETAWPNALESYEDLKRLLEFEIPTYDPELTFELPAPSETIVGRPRVRQLDQNENPRPPRLVPHTVDGSTLRVRASEVEEGVLLRVHYRVSQGNEEHDRQAKRKANGEEIEEHTREFELDDIPSPSHKTFDRLPSQLLSGRVEPKGPIDPSQYDGARDLPRVTTGNPHPTVKPTELMEWLIDRLIERGETVLDPFAGTGSTAIASLNQDRCAHLVELDEHDNYAPVIRNRLERARREVLADTSINKHRPDIELSWDEETHDRGGVSFKDWCGT